jgi:hypothetical protein
MADNDLAAANSDQLLARQVQNDPSRKGNILIRKRQKSSL